eukprot:scaffold62399_cov60-Phaeocystis_antarctica.AAC.2
MFTVHQNYRRRRDAPRPARDASRAPRGGGGGWPRCSAQLQPAVPVVCRRGRSARAAAAQEQDHPRGQAQCEHGGRGRVRRHDTPHAAPHTRALPPLKPPRRPWLPWVRVRVRVRVKLSVSTEVEAAFTGQCAH